MYRVTKSTVIAVSLEVFEYQYSYIHIENCGLGAVGVSTKADLSCLRCSCFRGFGGCIFNLLQAVRKQTVQ